MLCCTFAGRRSRLECARDRRAAIKEKTGLARRSRRTDSAPDQSSTGGGKVGEGFGGKGKGRGLGKPVFPPATRPNSSVVNSRIAPSNSCSLVIEISHRIWANQLVGVLHICWKAFANQSFHWHSLMLMRNGRAVSESGFQFDDRSFMFENGIAEAREFTHAPRPAPDCRGPSSPSLEVIAKNSASDCTHRCTNRSPNREARNGATNDARRHIPDCGPEAFAAADSVPFVRCQLTHRAFELAFIDNDSLQSNACQLLGWRAPHLLSGVR